MSSGLPVPSCQNWFDPVLRVLLVVRKRKHLQEKSSRKKRKRGGLKPQSTRRAATEPERDEMRRLELVRCEDVSSFSVRRVKLTLTSCSEEPLRGDHLDAALEDHPTGHVLVVRRETPHDSFSLSAGDEDGVAAAGGGGEEEGKVLYEHACGFLADVDATKIKLKRNKVRVQVVYVQQMREREGPQIFFFLMCRHL